MPITPREFCDRLKIPLPPGASAEAIDTAERALGVKLPSDYRAFVMHTDGLEADAGPEQWLRMYPVAELPELNTPGTGYANPDFPQLVLFATNAGGGGFFFDTRTPGPSILMIDFISNWEEDALPYGDSFTDFLEKVRDGWSPFGRKTY